MKKEGILYVSPYHESFLNRKLKIADYFINFVEVTEESEENKRKNYLRNMFPVFENLIPVYSKKRVGVQIYFASFLAKYPIIYEEKWNAITKYFIRCCSSSSLYLRDISLKVISSLGREDYLEEVLRDMNHQNIFHPIKLLTDAFLQFNGNKEHLIEMLQDHLMEYNENIKIACIEFFSYQKIDMKKIIFALLSSKEETKEVKLACIRYFGNAIYEPVTKALYTLLKEDTTNFEYAAVSANVLKSYPSKETMRQLYLVLKSPNWYVRNNAAESLVSFASEKELDEIQKIDDKYGKEAIQYHRMRLKKEVEK